LRAQRLQPFGHDGGAGDPIDVEVTEYADSLTAIYGDSQAADSGIHAGQL
jgi:hypothetical protein